MKKVIAFILCFLSIGVIVFAATSAVENKNAEVLAEKIISEENCKLKIEENFSKNSEIELFDKLSSVTDCCDEAKVSNIYAYFNFLCENSFSPLEISQINKILLKGTTVQSLAQVYDFYITTDEDFEIVEKICELEDKYFDEYWYEDAFNEITNNSHGVLDYKQLKSYEEKGLGLDQILAANILSRKEGQNIFDILDAMESGKSTKEFVKEIYGITLNSNYENDYEAVSDAVKILKYNVPSELTKNKKIDIKSVLSNIESTYAQLSGEKALKAVETLDVKNSAEYSYNDLTECNLTVNEKNALLNKGYTPDEILKACELKSDNIYEAVKKARRLLKNETIY